MKNKKKLILIGMLLSLILIIIVYNNIYVFESYIIKDIHNRMDNSDSFEVKKESTMGVYSIYIYSAKNDIRQSNGYFIYRKTILPFKYKYEGQGYEDNFYNTVIRTVVKDRKQVQYLAVYGINKSRNIDYITVSINQEHVSKQYMSEDKFFLKIFSFDINDNVVSYDVRFYNKNNEDITYELIEEYRND